MISVDAPLIVEVVDVYVTRPAPRFLVAWKKFDPKPEVPACGSVTATALALFSVTNLFRSVRLIV
jgi:hypothetical protein